LTVFVWPVCWSTLVAHRLARSWPVGGSIDYDAALEDILTGRGTNELVIHSLNT
jgi:hypothetical protein